MKSLVLALAAAGGTLASALDVEVTDAAEFVGGSSRIAAVTQKAAVDALPDVATPIFRFDCAQTNGWTFKEGTREVLKIPSLVGSRFLSTSNDGGSWRTFALASPVWTTSGAELGGRPYLDFGAMGSQRGMVFNPDPATATTAFPNGSNVLERIGTVFYVYGSQNGGGWLMGGGYGDNLSYNRHFSSGYLWHRGISRRELQDTGVNVHFADPVLRNPGYDPSVRGTIWHDGWWTPPQYAGFTGGWEALAFQPTNEMASATGIGMNDGRDRARSGGQRIAEMIVYDRHLTVFERQQVEAYLQAKWFDHVPRGWNGDARLGFARGHTNDYVQATSAAGVALTMDVPAGETLTVERVMGGRQEGAGLVKTGGGALRLGDAEHYAGTVTLRGGSLEFACRAVPDAPPTNVLVWLDAAYAAEPMRTAQDDAGVERLAHWTNRAPDSVVSGNVLVGARPAASDMAQWPVVRRDALGDGLPVLDFGVCAGSNAGMSLSFETNETSSAEVSIGGVCTVVAVVGSQAGGGHLVGHSSEWNSFSRVADTPGTSDGFFRGVSDADVANRRVLVYLDGQRADPAHGYLHPGYQVVALRGIPTQNGINRIGGAKTVAGGLRLAEILIYNRVLSDREFMDAQAYLARKWLDRDLPGYRRAEGHDWPAVQNVVVAEPSAIDVPAGATVRVGTLKVKAELRKTGAGTLEAERMEGFHSDDSDVPLKVEGGAVRVVGRLEPAADDAPAADPSLHLDATRLDRMDVVSVNGTNFVSRWFDARFRNEAVQDTDHQRPWVNDDADALCNGLPVVDFGRFSAGKGGKAMEFYVPMDSVRSAFVVWGAQNNGGFLLGSSGANAGAPRYGSNSYIFDFHRGIVDNAFTEKSPLLNANGTLAHVYNGEIYVDGVRTNYHYVPKADYQLVEIHTKGGAHVSALAMDRGGWDRRGGQRLGEVLLYERKLTERERVATRNYLMKKWFGREPEALPPAEETGASGISYSVISVDGERALPVDGDSSAGEVQGAGILEKTGAGALTVGDLSSFTGVVRVAEGTFALTGETAAVAAEYPADGIVYHADAEHGVSVVTNAAGVAKVSAWESRHDLSWRAVPGWSQTDSRHFPSYLPAGMNGRPAVDMVYGGTGADGWQFLRFQRDGEWARIPDVRSVFWVIGSQQGGGYLLGGGTNQYNKVGHWNFHRGLRATKDNTWDTRGCTNYLLGGAANSDARYANWWKNGVKVDPGATELSGAWDQLSMVMQDNAAKYADVEGFAFDGRSIEGGTAYLNRSGGQRLAEVLIYNRVLSDAERAGTEAYLRSRWGVGMHHAATNLAGVVVAEGAVFDLLGARQYVAAVGGNGVVRNGTLETACLDAGEGGAGTLTVDGDLALADNATWHVDFASAEAADFVDVSGSLSLGQGLAIELAGLEKAGNVRGLRVRIASAAGGVANPSALLGATFTGDALPASVTPTLRVNGGDVWLAFSPSGTVLVFR